MVKFNGHGSAITVARLGSRWLRMEGWLLAAGRSGHTRRLNIILAGRRRARFIAYECSAAAPSEQPAAMARQIDSVDGRPRIEKK
jgi:hypothetical protein